MEPLSVPPDVSVVIAAFNAGRFIAETLDSVLAQTHRSFEVIVVDDGSTDDTGVVVRRYHEVRYLYKDNGGQPSARNAGIRAARGLYVAFVDADDRWRPEKLQMQMEFLGRRPDLDWVYSDATLFDSATRRPLCRIGDMVRLRSGDILRPLLLADFIPSPTPLIKREVFDADGLFDESPELRIGEDWNMWLRIAAKRAIGLVPQPLAAIRQHQTRLSRSGDLEYSLKSKLLIVENAVMRDPGRLTDLRQRAIANVCLATGQQCLGRGERAQARELFLRSMRAYAGSVRPVLYLGATILPSWQLCALLDMRRKFGPYGSTCK